MILDCCHTEHETSTVRMSSYAPYQGNGEDRREPALPPVNNRLRWRSLHFQLQQSWRCGFPMLGRTRHPEDKSGGSSFPCAHFDRLALLPCHRPERLKQFMENPVNQYEQWQNDKGNYGQKPQCYDKISKIVHGKPLPFGFTWCLCFTGQSEQPRLLKFYAFAFASASGE